MNLVANNSDTEFARQFDYMRQLLASPHSTARVVRRAPDEELQVVVRESSAQSAKVNLIVQCASSLNQGKVYRDKLATLSHRCQGYSCGNTYILMSICERESG